MGLRLKLAACFLVVACLAAAAQAQIVISLNCAADGTWKTWNPGDAAGFVPALNWNNLPGPSGNFSLLENDGTTSGGTVAWSMPYGGSDYYSSQGGPTPNTIMMSNYIDAGSGGPLTLTFSGLPSSISSLYDVYVYIAGWPTLNRTGDYTLTTGSATTTIWATQGANALPFTLATNGTAGNYIEFADVSGGSFTLVTAASSGRAPVDGIQIVQATPAPIVPVPANALIWTGAQSTEWSTAVLSPSHNWTYNSAPVDYAEGSPVVFDDTAPGTTTVDISKADVSPASVLFNNSAQNYTLQSSGGFAVAGTTGLSKYGGGVLTINNTNKFTGPVTLAGGTIAVASIANGGVNSPLGAGTSLIFDGGALEYTGTDATPATDRSVTLNAGGGAIQVDNASTTLTLSGPISGPGGLTKTGPGALAVNNANTYAGATTINGGLLNFTFGALSLSNTVTNQIYFGSSGTLQWAGGNTQDISANLAPITAGQSATFDTNGNNVFFANGFPLGGAGTITKTGSGQLTLNSWTYVTNSNYSNAANLVLLAGTLQNNGYLWLGSFYGNGTGGTVSQSGGMMITGDIITNRGANATGTYNISGGTLQALSWDGYAIEVVEGNAGSVGTFNQTGGLVQATALDMYRGSAGQGGQGVYNLSGGTLAVTANAGLAPGTMWAGPTADSNPSNGVPTGVLTISNSNAQFNFTGGVFQVLNIDRSMTDITQTAASGPSLLDVTGNSTAINVNYTLTGNGTNAATVNVGSGQTLTMGSGVTLTLGDNAQFGTGSGTIQGAVAVTGSTNATFAGSIADASSYNGSLTKNGAGMLILSGNNTYTGPTTVSGGTLQIGNGASGEGLTSSITMSNNATVAFNHADPLSYSGTISGSGQLIKLGTGNLDLVGSGTYSGPTTISAGTLELDGNGDNLPAATALTIASGGALDLAGNPLTVGSLSGSAGAVVTNHYSPSYPSTLTVAPSSGSTTFAGNITGNDALALSGSGQLTLSGTNTYAGGTTVSGGTLDIAAPSALSGSGLVTIAAGGRLVLGSGAGIGALLAASPPAGSGAVALSAAAAPATIGGYQSASGNMAALGDAAASSQGAAGMAVGGTAAAVPEPGTFALSAAAAVGLIGWARRRRKAP